jgi:hypothetical protein
VRVGEKPTRSGEPFAPGGTPCVRRRHGGEHRAHAAIPVSRKFLPGAARGRFDRRHRRAYGRIAGRVYTQSWFLTGVWQATHSLAKFASLPYGF